MMAMEAERDNKDPQGARWELQLIDYHQRVTTLHIDPCLYAHRHTHTLNS